MQLAITLSLENVITGNGGPFGAVIVKDNQVIATGINQVTNSNDPTAHAEIVAIRNACKILNSFQLTDCELYTSCEPCPMCLGAIFWARPKKVYFAATAQDAAKINFDDAFIYKQINIPFEKRSIPFEQIMRDEAQIAFLAWQNKQDKIEY
jgi:guanine deaminase